MRNQKQQHGEKGESIAVEQLKKNGYKIIERNYRTKMGEIDIIAKDGDVIVFIEVKARQTTSYGNPKYAVTSTKQKKIARTAQVYLKSTNQLDKRARFDVVAIHLKEDRQSIEIIQNAFDLTGMS
ncbi:MAG: YraN family protein [Desulfobacterium sp.]|nr:YraN family protein [Desulfobacterium sp.]